MAANSIAVVTSILRWPDRWWPAWKGMDLLGCTIVGFSTAPGGGTVRDIVLGRLPLFWMANWDESILCLLLASLTFLLWPRLSRFAWLRSDCERLFWTDTVGVGAFAALGATTAAQVPHVNLGACAAAGMFSATFGGLLRDVLRQRPVRILHSDKEMYALPAFVGALATAVILRLSSPFMEAEALMLGFIVTVELRVLAVNHNTRLPTFPAAHCHS